MTRIDARYAHGLGVDMSATQPGTLTPERRRHLLGLSDLGRTILAEEDAAAKKATFATTGRHTPAVLAKLTANDFADPATLTHPLVDQQDVDDLGRMDGAHWITKAVRDHVIALCRRRGLDAPLKWLPADETNLSPRQRTQRLEESPLGRAMLRGVPRPPGSMG